MGKVTAGRPELHNPLTLSEAAEALSEQFGVEIKPQQVYYWAVRRQACEIGTKRIRVLILKDVDAISADDLPILAEYARAALDGQGVATLDARDPNG